MKRLIEKIIKKNQKSENQKSNDFESLFEEIDNLNQKLMNQNQEMIKKFMR